jgi:hypothetical protein
MASFSLVRGDWVPVGSLSAPVGPRARRGFRRPPPPDPHVGMDAQRGHRVSLSHATHDTWQPNCKIAQDEAAPRFVDSAHGAHVVVRIECDEPWAREDLELWLAEAPETLRLTLVGRLNPGIDPKMVTGQPTDAERALGIKRV